MNFWLALSAGFGFLAVLFGAAGAHMGGDQPEGAALRQFETGVRYQMWHGVALLGVALRSAQDKEGQRLSLRIAGGAFSVGIVLFSGSLYALSISGTSNWGFFTPIGGSFFLIGWLALFLNAFPRRK